MTNGEGVAALVVAMRSKLWLGLLAVKCNLVAMRGKLWLGLLPVKCNLLARLWMMEEIRASFPLCKFTLAIAAAVDQCMT